MISKIKDQGLIASNNATISQKSSISKKENHIPIFPPQENVSQLQSRKTASHKCKKHYNLNMKFLD